MYKILDGIRILDLTNVLAGPFCTYNLSMFGAEVIKIERPETGDLSRKLGVDQKLNDVLMGASFLAQNANKKSIVLDLKNKNDINSFKKLVLNADILVENFRPGVMQRLGLGFKSLNAINEKLIYCSISGFGQDSYFANRPAYDQIIQGMSGVMSLNGNETLNPLRCNFPICDTVGGLTAAFAIVSAIFKRTKTGRGAYIDISLLDSILPMMGWAASNYLIAGVKPKPLGNENFTSAPSGTFYASDGPFNIAANEEKQWRNLCKGINKPYLLEDEHFITRDKRKQNRDELNKILNNEFKLHTVKYWINKMIKLDVPCGEIFSLDQILNSEYLKGRNMLKSYNIKKMDKNVQVLDIAPKFLGFEITNSSAPPELGEHNNEILNAKDRKV